MSRPLRRASDPRDQRAAAAPRRPHLAFTIGTVAFAFDAAHARHVLHASKVAPEPVRFRDHAYPVLDLRRLFGHPAPSGTGFVVLVEAGARAGLHVDDVRGLCALDPGALAPLPAVYRGPERRWIAGLAPNDDGVIVVVRVAELLATFPADDGLGAVR